MALAKAAPAKILVETNTGNKESLGNTNKEIPVQPSITASQQLASKSSITLKNLL